MKHIFFLLRNRVKKNRADSRQIDSRQIDSRQIDSTVYGNYSSTHSLFLATEGPLKMIKNVFYFTLKARFVLKIFKFLSCLFSHVEKWLH